MPFKKLGLSENLVKSVEAAGYTEPTDIQAQAIPLVLEGKDVIGCAQTGTGKTAAFVLPVLQRLFIDSENAGDNATPTHDKKAQKRYRDVRALVLAPTRELALQVEESVQEYGKFTGVKPLAVYGGVGIEPQIHALKHGVDIVVATPGRLLDLLERKSIDLSAIEILVLDEADRMLDMGFIHDVRKVISIIPKERQTLLFSATISNDIKKLADGVQNNPVVIQIGQRHNPAESVTQYIYDVPREKKLDLLIHILANEHMDSVLIFSRTKHGADKIAKRLLREGTSTTTIHSNKSQSQRQRALDGFKRGQFKVLVATDIAARGLDVEGISHVINFDTPAFAEDYIHRIGRTGRAEATGDAITLVSRDELDYLRKIERFTKQRFERKQYPGFDYSAKPVSSPVQAAKPVVEPREDQPETRPDRPQHKAPTHKPPFNRGGQHRKQDDRRNRPFDRRERRPERRDDQPDSSFGRRDDRPERRNAGGRPSASFNRHQQPHSSQRQQHSRYQGAPGHRVRSKHYQKPGQQPAHRSVTEEIFNPTSAPWKSSDFYAAHPSPIKKHRGKDANKNRYGGQSSAYAKFDNDGHKTVTTMKKRKFSWNIFKKNSEDK